MRAPAVFFLIALFLLACGESDPNPLASRNVSLSGSLAGRVVDQFTGEGLVGITVTYRGGTAVTGADGYFAVSGDRTGNRIRFRAPTILSRIAYVSSGDSLWKVVPAEFDTVAFNDIGRAYSSYGTIRWSGAPTVYIDTSRHCFTGGAPEVWAEEARVQAAAFVAAWTADMAHPSVFVTDTPPDDFTPGTIIVHFSECTEDLGPYIGLARTYWDGKNRIVAATIHARFKKYESKPGKRKGILGLELGHTLGYRHMFAGVPSLMEASLGSKTALAPFDHLAARFLYGRVPKNRHPDNDGRGSTSLALAGSGGYWEGE